MVVKERSQKSSVCIVFRFHRGDTKLCRNRLKILNILETQQLEIQKDQFVLENIKRQNLT